MTAANSYNVVAAFDDGRTARRAAEDLSRRGVAHVRLVGPGEVRDKARVGELRAEMQDEVVESFAGSGISLVTPDQAKGASVGSIVGAAAGLCVGLVAGFIWANLATSAMSEAGRIAIMAVCGVAAGATIGFIAGGALKPRYEGAKHPGKMLDEKRLEGERLTLVAVEAIDERQAHLAHELLEGAGATRIDDVDREGEPLPPQSRHPRPADPPDWWSNGGRGKG